MGRFDPDFWAVLTRAVLDLGRFDSGAVLKVGRFDPDSIKYPKWAEARLQNNVLTLAIT